MEQIKNNMKDYLLKESDLLIGKDVWSITYGKGMITNIDEKVLYSIKVLFEYKNKYEDYTLEGRRVLTHLHPSLFKSNPFEKLKSEFPKWMMVSSNKIDWEKRYVMAKNPINDYWVAITGASSTSDLIQHNTLIASWRYAKEIEEPKDVILSMEDIAKLANCDVNQLKIIK